MKGSVGDLQNISGPATGLDHRPRRFSKNFVETFRGFIDIAGSERRGRSGLSRRSLGNGCGVRLLLEYLERL